MLERIAAIPPGFVTPDGERLHLRAYAFLILLCLAFFTPGLATLPPTDRDESLFAQASKQMIESGNYIDIRVQDVPRYKKPGGIYWLQAASERLLNPQHLNEIWAYRVPSLIGATVAVVMTAALGALLFGPTIGFLAAVMMAGCLILNVEARLAKTDAALLGCIMVMQYALARAYIGMNVAKSWGLWLTFWTALAIGILIKGPVILLVLFSVLIWLRLTEKNITWFGALRPLAGILYLLLLIAPWFAAIMMASHGQFANQAGGHDFLAKFWQGQNRGLLPPGLHLLAFPVIFFPFALYALLGIPDAWRNRDEPAVRFCLGWIIPVWIVFELSLTKLPHYVLPTYPAIALLAAKVLMDGFPALAGRGMRMVPPVVMGLMVTIGTTLALTLALLPYFAGHVWNWGQLASGALLVIAQGASLLFLLRRQESSVLVLAAGQLIFIMSIFSNTLPNLQHVWLSRDAVRIAESVKPCERTQIVAAGYNEPSLVFLAGTDTKLAPNGAEAAKNMQADRCLVGAIADDQKKSFLEGFSGAAAEPSEITGISGFDLGRGKQANLTIYLAPAKP